MKKDTYNLEELKSIPIRELATRLGVEIIGNQNTGNARCFNQQAHPGGDKNPSLGFSRANRFKCFSCDIAGSTIDLVMQTQGLEFKEACEWLANDYGLNRLNYTAKKVAYKDITPESNPPTPEDSEIYKKFYSYCEPLNEAGQNLLKSKGFTQETIKRFGWKTITPEAITKIKSDPRVEKSGLSGLFKPGWCLIPFYQDTDIYYLRVRNPEIKGFANPIGKDTQIYNYNALCELTGGKTLYICEGETDTMTLAQQGLQAIGILGATQDRTINKLAELIVEGFSDKLPVVLCFDNDKGGREATEKTASKFLSLGLRVKVKQIPDNYKDINDYANNKEINGKQD